MKIRSRLLTKMAAWGAVRLFRLLFRTCHFRFHYAPGTNAYEGTGTERFLYPVWHDSLLLPIFSARVDGPMATLVSRHQDGSYLADALQMIGLGTVRGSTNRGGASAVRQLMTTAKDQHIVITPDGPRGPRRQLKSGIVFLASHTGRRIVPTAYAAARAWRIQGSWTDMSIPKPFTTVHLLSGDPIEIPAELSRPALKEYTARVQEAMEALNDVAERLASGEQVDLPDGMQRAAA